MSDITAIAQQLFENDAYAVQTTGIQILYAGDNRAVCQLQVAPMHMNAAGIVMGGAIFTLADLACSVAANSPLLHQGETQRLWLSLNATINYLRPAKGTTTLTAEARCIKSGKTTCLYNIEVTDENRTLIAIIQSTAIRPL